MARGPWIDHFGDNFLWSNATLILKGMAPYGVVALEEIDRTCEKLRARQEEADKGSAWKEEWRTLGAQVEKRADEAFGKGYKITAGDYYLRAGLYRSAPMLTRFGIRASACAIPPSNSSRFLTKAQRCAPCSCQRRTLPGPPPLWSWSTAWTTPRR
jgi:hypothetical protein